jgi:trans-aconitate methyltransferase
MSVMHVGQSDAQVQRWLRWDEESRQLITGAMLGCQERASMKKGESRIVLDLGSGSARDRDYLMQRFDADYSGIEVVKDAADRTAHLGVRHLAIEEMPAEWNGKIQFMYSRHVMEHVVDLNAALGAIKRVLAPHGIVGAVTPHVFPDPEPAHVTVQTIHEWCAHYKRHGLRPVYAKLESMACIEAHIVCIHEEWAARVLGP